MYKTAARIAPRSSILPCRTQQPYGLGERFLSFAPPAKKSRSWKSSALRWGLAGGAVYYYNTSNVFAEEPDASIQHLDDSIHIMQESKLPTVDAIFEEKRRRQAERIAEEEKKALEEQTAASIAGHDGKGQESEQEEGAMGGLEEEAGQQGAFNEETGEINWDCPCLGGMAHGPCGEEFKAAFSCFVYSNEEPKGMECIDKFKGMQDCFRAHPEIYATELEEEEEEIEEELRAREAAQGSEATARSEQVADSQPEDLRPRAREQPQQRDRPENPTGQAANDQSDQPSARSTNSQP